MRRFTGRESAESVLQLFNFSYPLTEGETYDSMEETVSSLPVLGIFLPLKIVRTERAEYEILHETLPIDELKTQIAQIAFENAASDLPEGCVIVDKWIDYSMIEGECISARAVMEIESNIACTRDALKER